MTSLIYVDEMKTHLCGMYWTPGKSPLAIPYFGSAFKSAMVFKQNLAEITWNCMRTLENNPTSLPQTRTILAGQSVGGISVFDLLQVKNYGDASKLLIDKVRSNTFALDKATACAIHNLSEPAAYPSKAWNTCRRKLPPWTPSPKPGSAGSTPPSPIPRNALSRRSSLCRARSSFTTPTNARRLS